MFVLFNFLSSFVALSFVLPGPVTAFTFTLGSPSECGNLPISWTGGTPPFYLLLTPVFGLPQNTSIPTSAFANGAGLFSMQLQLPATTQFLLTMSDATGFNSGGTTPLLTVASREESSSSCNTTSPAIAFSFELNDALTQCIPFGFTGYSDAVQPVTIAAFIPGGTAFELNPPPGSASFSWTADVIHGTSMIFSMTDAQGRQGGSSDIRVVGLSSDSSCLNSSSPSSTPAAPSPTTSTSASSNPTSTSPINVPSHGVSAAGIVGTVVAALLFLAVIVTLGLFFFRKKRDHQSSSNVRRFHQSSESEVDLSFDHQAPVVTPYNVPQNYDASLSHHPYHSSASPSFNINPFEDVPPQSPTYQPSSQHQHPGAFHSPSQYYPSVPGYPLEIPVSDSSASRPEFGPQPTSTSTSQRKATMEGVTAYKPSRFILHTDADDDLPQPNDDGVIELPPQYSERRGVANSTPDSNAGYPPGK